MCACVCVCERERERERGRRRTRRRRRKKVRNEQNESKRNKTVPIGIYSLRVSSLLTSGNFFHENLFRSTPRTVFGVVAPTYFCWLSCRQRWRRARASHVEENVDAPNNLLVFVVVVVVWVESFMSRTGWFNADDVEHDIDSLFLIVSSVSYLRTRS